MWKEGQREGRLGVGLARATWNHLKWRGGWKRKRHAEKEESEEQLTGRKEGRQGSEYDFIGGAGERREQGQRETAGKKDYPLHHSVTGNLIERGGEVEGAGERQRRRGGGREEERGKRHRDLIAVRLSAELGGCEQCSLRHSLRGRGGVGE